MDRLQEAKEAMERRQMKEILDRHYKEAIYKAMEEYAKLKQN